MLYILVTIVLYRYCEIGEKLVKKIEIFSLIIISILIIVGTFYDYQITSKFNGHLLLYGRFFEIMGDLPVTVGLSLIATYYSSLIMKKPSKYFKILGVLLVIISVFLSSIIFIVIFKYLNPVGGHSSGPISNPYKFVSLILGTMFLTYFILVLNKISYIELKKYKKLVLFALTMILTVLIGTNIIKIISGRPRFWLISEGQEEFRKWYYINPFASGNEYMSFISGHTANAMLMILITLIPTQFVTRNKRKLLIFAISWGILTGASRIFSGQHFLTDVTFAILFVGIVYKIFVRIFKLERLKSNIEYFNIK